MDHRPDPIPTRTKVVRLRRSHYLIVVGAKAFMAIRTEDRRWVLSEVTYGVGLLLGAFGSLRAARQAAQEDHPSATEPPGTLMGGVAA